MVLPDVNHYLHFYRTSTFHSHSLLAGPLCFSKK